MQSPIAQLSISTMFLNVNKPSGMSSFGVVKLIKRYSREKRVGHAGTLDPFATGVLVVAVGRESTKQLQQIVGMEKEYIGEVHLGVTTDTYDVEGKVVETHEFTPPKCEDIQLVLRQFEGEIEQQPPVFSAIKLQGVRAYKLARKGEDVEMPSRMVFVKEINLLETTDDGFTVKVVCGKGTYIRSLANDIGNKLGMGGYLHSLVRTRIGDFSIDQSVTLEQVKTIFSTAE